MRYSGRRQGRRDCRAACSERQRAQLPRPEECRGLRRERHRRRRGDQCRARSEQPRPASTHGYRARLHAERRHRRPVRRACLRKSARQLGQDYRDARLSPRRERGRALERATASKTPTRRASVTRERPLFFVTVAAPRASIIAGTSQRLCVQLSRLKVRRTVIASI